MKFKLDMFKESGKWYSTGEMFLNVSSLYTGVDIIRKKRSNGDLPGLMAGSGKDLHVVVTVMDEGDQEGLSSLLLMDESEKEEKTPKKKCPTLNATCIEDECGWWDGEDERCSVRVIAGAIDEMAYSEDEKEEEEEEKKEEEEEK